MNISETIPQPIPKQFMCVSFESTDDSELNCMLGLLAVMRSFDISNPVKRRLAVWIKDRIEQLANEP